MTQISSVQIAFKPLSPYLDCTYNPGDLLYTSLPIRKQKKGNSAPLLADLFLYSHEAEFIQSLLRSDKKTVAKSFNFTYRYIDDVLSLNNPTFGDYLEVIYPTELEVKDTTESINSASYLDLQLE